MVGNYLVVKQFLYHSRLASDNQADKIPESHSKISLFKGRFRGILPA
jgi:hypothetical protein